MNVKSLREKVEQKEKVSIEELEKFIGSFIPDSCDDCIWLKDEDRSFCPSPEGAPCRIYLNKVFKHLESEGFI